jgi:hypothetical protein
MSSDTARPEVARGVIEEVDDTLREATGVPVDELGFESKVLALLEGYAGGGAADTADESGEPEIHPQVVRRIRDLEGNVVDILDRLDKLADRVDDHDEKLTPDDGVSKEEIIRQMNGRPPQPDENTGLDALIDDTETRRY